ncbi:hypothetical protein XENORESO_011439 [Xenotaenia resolanae]|uniref:Uncharacterized protein n=1 Tax=Xenotaenia resolanae TaxID=208358 RepID=A0ABV0VWC6_9TELE
MPGTETQPQLDKRGNKTCPTPTPGPPTRNTQPKWQAHPNASSGPAKAHTPPIDKRTETHRASQAVKQTLQCTTPPTTVPKGKTPAQQAEGRHRKATAHTAKRLHFYKE